MRVDGRSERLRKGIDEDFQKVGDALKLVAFNESFDGLFLTGDALKAFQQELTKKAQALALQKKSIGACKAKIGRSVQGLFADELDQLLTLSEQLKEFTVFIQFTQNPKNVDWNAYRDSFQSMSLKQPVSKPYVLRAMEAAHAGALRFDDDDAVCETFKTTSPIGSALHLACSGEEVVCVFTAKTEGIVIDMLKKYER